KAAGAGRPWWEWAATFERSFTWAYDQLGVLPPSIEPRATGHVTQMVEMMERLIENGHAYAAGGDVYFDVQSYPEYGALSGHKLDDVHQGESAAEGKRDPRDFTLWKAVKPGEPSWPTPWGPGRPGWHLECSAMAEFYLGAAFDIHCGGRDLVFPHHENEIAQAKCAGDDFAQYWLHNGWVTMSGEKMSKSLGNVLSVPNVLKKVRPQELRYYLGSAHYRSNLEYSDEALDESAKSYQGLESFVLRTHKRAGGVELGTWTEGFAAALDNDLSVPIALAEIHGKASEGNSALAPGDLDAARVAAGQVRAMLAIRGVDPLDEHWTQSGGDTETAMEALDVLVRADLDRRQQARRAVTMAGNSSRRGAVRKGGTKKGQVAGSGGKHRRGLEGRGATPPAEARTKHPAAKRAARAARADEKQGRGGRPGPGRKVLDGPQTVLGRNPVVECLRAGVPATALWVAVGTESDDRLKESVQLAADAGISILEVPRTDLDRLSANGLHQGIALQVPPYRYAHPDDLLSEGRKHAEPPLLVALDNITDPRNLGAVVRSVAAFGGHGVVIPERRSASVSAVAWRTSAGAAARLPIARATNLTRTLKDWASKGVQVVGLDAEGDTTLDDFDGSGPVVIVVGSEGKGLSRLVRENCDAILSIPMAGPVESLNASVAAGVVLADIARRRRSS
ncbi:hypothetical protein P4O66_022617, partial [Electrophorus voltai]